MLGIYFSATGNTKYCVERLVNKLDKKSKSLAMEDPETLTAVQHADGFIFGYGVKFSNVPKIVHDWILANKFIFNGKKILIIATMGAFSGDGSGCAARLFQKCGAQIVGGLHLHMPDVVADSKMLKKPLAFNKELVIKAGNKIDNAAYDILNGKYPKEGLNIFYHIAGLLGQRLWFYSKTSRYSNRLKVDSKKCILCGLCVKNCPMDNLYITENKLVIKGQCTECYRCINRCPKQALTSLGKKVVEQCSVEKYL